MAAILSRLLPPLRGTPTPTESDELRAALGRYRRRQWGACLAAGLSIAFLGGLGIHEYRQCSRELKQLRHVVASRQAYSHELSFRDFANLYGEEDGRSRLTNVAYDEDTRTCRLSFDRGVQGEFTCEGRPLPVTANTVEVALPDYEQADAITQTILCQCNPRPETVTVQFHTPRHYRERGMPATGYLMANTTLPRSAPESGDLFARVADRREPMLALLGGDVASLAERDRATMVVKRLVDLIATAPVNSASFCIHQHGLDVINDIRAGRSHIDCTGSAVVGRDFLLAAGLRARIVHLASRSDTSANGVEVQSSSNHATNEAQCEGEWFWCDLPLRVLHVRVEGDPGWLSLWDVLRHLNDPALRPRLVFAVYDPTDRLVREIRLDASPLLEESIMAYLSADKVLRFLK